MILKQIEKKYGNYHIEKYIKVLNANPFKKYVTH